MAVLLESADAVLAVTPEPIDFDLGVVGPHPPGSPHAIEVRAFFPKDGTTAEDPVTGSLNASLAQWLLGSGRLDAPYVATQGTALGRAGRVHVVRDDRTARSGSAAAPSPASRVTSSCRSLGGVRGGGHESSFSRRGAGRSTGITIVRRPARRARLDDLGGSAATPGRATVPQRDQHIARLDDHQPGPLVRRFPCAPGIRTTDLDPYRQPEQPVELLDRVWEVRRVVLGNERQDDNE